MIIALKTRRMLGYSLSDRRPDELVLNALRNAGLQGAPSRGTLFHSDRGGQDVRDDVRHALDALGMVVRMSRKGNGWDNAVTESFFATLKAEDATEPYATKQEAHRAIAESIHGFYNPVRLHSEVARFFRTRRGDKWTDCCTFPLWKEQIRCEDRDETIPRRSRPG